jgi:hypothetical protein
MAFRSTLSLALPTLTRTFMMGAASTPMIWRPQLSATPSIGRVQGSGACIAEKDRDMGHEQGL